MDVSGFCPANVVYGTAYVVLRGGFRVLVACYHELHPETTGGTRSVGLPAHLFANFCFRGFAGTLLLQLKDLIAFVTPKEQKAFLKGRSFFHHVWGSRGAWEPYTVGALLTVDFAKAYDSVQHAYMCAVVDYLGVDRVMVALLIYLFRAPFVFAVGRGVVREEKVYPCSGVR